MNKYEIIGVVGEGAYGIVLKCKNRETGEFVAIKKFKETDDDEGVRKSIQREVKMLRTLKHPNIIQLKEAFKKKGKIFLVFSFVDRNLLELLEDKKTLDVSKLDHNYKQDTIKKIIYQLVLAIHCCHSNGIAHRDIKPENLLIDADLNMKLCDFGFARQMTSQEILTDYVATRWYRSPELLISNNYGKQVDIWAIGCIMGELIDGQPLFPGENEMDQLYLIQKQIGTLTQEQMETFQKNPRYLGMKFPDITKSQSLDARYHGKMCAKGMDFLKATLTMDPQNRLTIQECLDHPYLKEFNNVYQRPISNVIKRRISCEREDSKPHIAQDTQDLNKQRKIIEKAVPTTLQNNSYLHNQIYNYKITDEKELKEYEDHSNQTQKNTAMHKTFNQSFKIKHNENPQSRLGSDNQDKRINRLAGFPNIREEEKTPQQKMQKSPIKKPQQGGFYMQGNFNHPGKMQQLNLVYNSNTYNYSIKKSVVSKK